MTMFIDGATRPTTDARHFAEHIMGWAPPAVNAWVDRDLYHPAHPKDYGSTIGMPIEDSQGRVIGYCCVGCWWCEGDYTAAHHFVASDEAA